MDNSGTLTAADQIVFTVTVSNLGPDAATGVVLTDQLPNGYTYQGDDSGGTYNFNTGVWSIGTIAGGSSASLNIMAEITNPVPGSPNYTNVAEVTASGTLDPNSTPNNHNANENDQASLTPSIGTAADLSLTKTMSPLTGLSHGSPVVFTLTVTNNGPNNATGVSVVDLLPAGYAFVSYVAAGGQSYTSVPACGTSAHPTTGSNTTTLVINATVVGGQNAGAGAYTNYAQIRTSDQFDPTSTPGNSSGQLVPHEDDDSLGDPGRHGSGGHQDRRRDRAVPGNPVTYTLTVTNNGPHLVRSVTLTDTVPAALLNPVFGTPSSGSYDSLSGLWNATGATSRVSLTSTGLQATGGASTAAVDQSRRAVRGLCQHGHQPGRRRQQRRVRCVRAGYRVEHDRSDQRGRQRRPGQRGLDRPVDQRRWTIRRLCEHGHQSGPNRRRR